VARSSPRSSCVSWRAKAIEVFSSYATEARHHFKARHHFNAQHHFKARHHFKAWRHRDHRIVARTTRTPRDAGAGVSPSGRWCDDA